MLHMIHPIFTADDFDGNTRKLCDLLWLPDASAVPVDHFAIVADGTEMVVAVGPGKYRSALLLFYLMTKSAAPTFELTDEMRRLVADYFGHKIMDDARHPKTKHQTVRALLGHTVYIRLTLKEGYREHLVTGRTPEEVIRHAWERRSDIYRQSPEPFLRHALRSFFQQIEDGTLQLDETADHWPTPEWADRALTLENLLKH